jgi:hypothetical protein
VKGRQIPEDAKTALIDQKPGIPDVKARLEPDA